MGDDRPAIVVTSPKSWDACFERYKQSKLPLNYYSNSLTVEFVYPDGEFSHGHQNVLHLEPIDHWENECEWNLLQAVNKLMKGTGSIQSVFDTYKATET